MASTYIIVAWDHSYRKVFNMKICPTKKFHKNSRSTLCMYVYRAC